MGKAQWYRIVPGNGLWVLAHGCSQFKHHKLKVGGYTEEVLEWFDYPCASAHPGYEVNLPGCVESTRIVASPVFC